MKLSIQNVRECSNRHADWAKKNPRKAILLYLLLLWALNILWWHIKPKHPGDLFFRPESFRIENYHFGDQGKGDAELAGVLRELLPVGSSRADVEKILIDYAGLEPGSVRKTENGTSERYNYRYSVIKDTLITLATLMNPRFWIIVEYDQTDKLRQIRVEQIAVHPSDESAKEEYK